MFDLSSLTLFLGLTGVAAIGYQVLKLVAQVRAGDWDMVVKLVIVVGVCVLAALLLWSTDFAEFIAFDAGEGRKLVLSTLSAATVVWLGIAIGFIVAAGTDVLRALDNTRTSSTPPIVQSPPEG